MLIFEELVKILKEKKLHITAAESCTGGLFSSEIVAIPDASYVLDAAFVTYSEEAKSRFAFVEPDIIKNYGVVSEETALQMAAGSAKNANADIGVGFTGFAGPSGGDEFAKTGTVCIGFYVLGKTKTLRLFFDGKERNEIRLESVKKAAEILIEMLK